MNPVLPASRLANTLLQSFSEIPKTVTALRRRLLSVPPHAQIEQLLAACQRFENNDLMVGGAS